MQPELQHAFDSNRDYFLGEAARLWNFHPDAIEHIGSFESHVYRYTRDDRRYILKFTHEEHRSLNLIRGELDWVVYLADRGVWVSPAVASIGGRFVEPLDMNGPRVAACTFCEAPGRHARGEDFTPDFIRRWGEMIGGMHAATMHYRPSSPEIARYHWHQDQTLQPSLYDGVVEPAIVDELMSQAATIKGYRESADSYGLIHNDLHPGNFFTDGERLTAFDFDDCHYAFFINDIAMALFYALRPPGVPACGEDFAHMFITSFMEGYRRHHDLDSTWLERIPEFMRLREIDLYCIILLYEAPLDDPWIASYMEDRRESILQHRPILEMDFRDY